jgi:hypothetical protein
LSDSFLATFPAQRHFGRSAQSPFVIGMQDPALLCFIESATHSQRGENVVRETGIGIDVARILRDQPWHVRAMGELYELGS